MSEGDASRRFGTVALVDDSDADNFLHRMMLEESGMAERIEVFRYAEDALRYLARRDRPKVDLILLDINMPRMDGFEFVSEYAELDPECRRSTIVVLTTSLSEVDRESAETHPEIAGFVSKPLTRDALAEIARLGAGGSSGGR